MAGNVYLMNIRELLSRRLTILGYDIGRSILEILEFHVWQLFYR